MKQRMGGDRFGTHRVISPAGVLPQQAEQLDVSLPIYDNELLIDVKALNVDSASFYQIKEHCSGDLFTMEKYFFDLIKKRGKQHNPVTGSGGMLIGEVKEVGSRFLEGKQKSEVLKPGDRMATLVSLTLTPLHIDRIHKVQLDKDRVDVSGYAILFQSGPFAKLPSDISEGLALAVLDVCGAPAHTAAMCKPGQTVVAFGGAGKSGILSLYEAKKAVGSAGRVIALDYSPASLDLLNKLSFVDEAGICDARDAVKSYELIQKLTNKKMADVVINVTNIPDTEMSCILSAKPGGTVYYFSTATSFTKAALGSEGVGADVKLVIGNGYLPGHAELTLNILRDSKEIRQLYESKYGSA